MSSGERTTKTKLTSENAGCDYPCKLASVITRICGMCSSNAEEVKTGRLRLQHCATAYGADLYAGHRD